MTTEPGTPLLLSSTVDSKASRVTQLVRNPTQLVRNPPPMQETLVQFLGWEDTLEKR